MKINNNKNKYLTHLANRLMRNLVYFLFVATVALHAKSPVSLNVSVDPRIELLYIVWGATKFPQHFRPYENKSRYAEDVSKAFGPFMNHRAVRLFDELTRGGRNWAFDAPPTWILCYGPSPMLEPITPLPERVLQAGGGMQALSQLVDAFRAFARDTQFDAFFNAHHAFYEQLEQNFHQSTRSDACWTTLTQFFGTAPDHAEILLAPQYNLGNYAVKIQDFHNSSFFYEITSPKNYKNEVYCFDSYEMTTLIFHEFGHSFSNPAVLAFPGRTAHSDWLPLIIDSMRKQAYTDWDTVLCESVVRAGELYFLERLAGLDWAERRRQELIKEGWFWVPYLAERMKIFPLHRNIYPTFTAFMPYLLQVLDDLEPTIEIVPDKFQGTRARQP